MEALGLLMRFFNFPKADQTGANLLISVFRHYLSLTDVAVYLFYGLQFTVTGAGVEYDLGLSKVHIVANMLVCSVDIGEDFLQFLRCERCQDDITCKVQGFALFKASVVQLGEHRCDGIVTVMKNANRDVIFISCPVSLESFDARSRL
ncbi:Hypothetical predicted protein [Octopus vulgaris]|uniref:Uncharacterized protein n=1 Tax=Octopus vulgaris TaxID=6645 RepID=A0AA36AQM4_OCTVU|nr:Hypothetical predicted protein [Octopus vulgaris]